MAEHKNMNELISRYVDGELTEREKQTLEEHLKQCPSCRAVLSAYTALSESMADSAQEPPADFTRNVMNAIKKLPADDIANKPDPANRKTIRTVAITFAAAAACLAVVLLMSPQLLGRTASSPKDAPMNELSAPGDVMYDIASDADNAIPESALCGEANEEDGARTYSESPGNVGMQSAPAALPSDESAASNEAAADAGSAAPDEPGGNASALPEPSVNPSAETGTGGGMAIMTTTSGAPDKTTDELLKIYYAVIYIDGQLPDIVDNTDAVTEDGAQKIEIPADTAIVLLEDGYPANRGDETAETALVIFYPA